MQDYLEAQKGQPTPLTDAMRKRRPATEHVRPADPLFRNNIPADFHPHALGKDDGTVAYSKGHQALEALWNVHAKLIDTAIKVTNRAELAKQVEGVVLKTIKSARTELDGLDRQIAHAESEIATSIGSGVGQLAQEVRSIVRSAKPGERGSIVRGLIASGDLDSLKALAAVPPLLSGLDDETYRFVRDETQRLANPKAYAERESGTKARARLDRAITDFDEAMAGNIRRWRQTDDQIMADMLKALAP